MEEEEALRVADEAVFAKTGTNLTDLQRAIFRGSWESQPYKTIAENYRCSEQHAKNEGTAFWAQLSQALGEKVRKKNFRAALERRWQAPSAESQPLADPAAVEETTAKNPGFVGREGSLADLKTFVHQGAKVPPLPQDIAAPEETTAKNPDFVGREAALADLKTFVQQGAKVIGIYGKGGVGKTTLVQRYFESQGFMKVLTLRVAMETEDITPVEELIRYRLRHDFDEEKPEQDFGLMLEQLRSKLQTKRVGVLIDNLEPALDEKGKFIKAHRRYVELLRVLAEPTVQSVTLITSRERLNESRLTVQPYPLPELDQEAWREFFSYRDIDIASQALSEIHKAYGGNAKAMQIVCGAIQNDCAGDLDAYWQLHQVNLLIKAELKDLVASQFDRLKEIDTAAYRLLCRLGVYRYQDIPRVPRFGVSCLLWDVPEEERERVIESLGERYLVESHKGEYWLHPVIRAEAIARLRSSGESKGDILRLMKRQIDAIVAGDEGLQEFLRWASQKAGSVQVPYKPGAVRGFYLSFESDVADHDGFTFRSFLELGYKLGLADLDYHSVSFGNRLVVYESLDLDSELNAALARAIHIAYLGFGSGLNLVSDLENILDGDFARELDIAIDPELKQALQHLKDQLPNPEGDRETRRQWWKTNGQTWTEQLRDVLIVYRNIGHYRQFSPEQEELLEQYYDANHFLVDCLNSGCEVSPAVREEIEETLLLPASEIPKPQM